jgi:hypothetical protein
MNMNSLTTKDFGWGSPTFHKMGRQKITLCRQFISMGFDLLLTDVDTVFLRNPLPFIVKYPQADILVSSDMLSTSLPVRSQSNKSSISLNPPPAPLNSPPLPLKLPPVSPSLILLPLSSMLATLN